MTSRMTSPPRTVELFLETLGAEPAMRDAVVGDLAEEYAWLVDAVGEKDARRWYRRETLRAVPLLLRSALRNTTWGDVRRRARTTIGALMLTLIASRVASFLLTLVFEAFTRTLDGSPPSHAIEVVGFNLLMLTTTGLAAGYIAARLDDRAPFMSALALALPWSAGHIVHSTYHELPMTQVVTEAVAFVVLVVLGGLLQLRRRAAHEARSERTCMER